jgi:FKBP-type peptidyl-prolyl cis-trans isomerase (trigger factor)
MQGLQRGITWEQHLMHLKKSEDELKKELRSQAERQVRTRMGLQRFLEEDGVKATDSEVEKVILARQARMSEKEKQSHKESFKKGSRGWHESEHRVKISKWIDAKLKELVSN